MKHNILIIFIYLLISCNQDNNIKYTYYHSGKIKEKIVLKSTEAKVVNLYSEVGNLTNVAEFKHDKFDGNCRAYFDNGKISGIVQYKNGMRNGKLLIFYPNGKIKIEKTYLNDSLYGISKHYNEVDHLKVECLYINGTMVVYNEYFRNLENTIDKVVYNIVNHDKKTTNAYGQLVIDKKNNLPVKSQSFYYIINKGKDTLSLNEENNFNIEFINNFSCQLELQIGSIDELMNITEYDQIYKSNNNKISFYVTANKKGWNLITGKLIVHLNELKFKDKEYEFIIFDDFYVRE
jgi:hypothetical protein